MSWPILSLELSDEEGIVAARRRAREVAALLGFDLQDQTRLATAVSEIARNAVGYGGGGRATFVLEEKEKPQALVVRIEDRGRGIPDLPAILEGRYRSPSGMGMGILGARRLVERFEITSAADGTVVQLAKTLPRSAGKIDQAGLRRVIEGLARGRSTPLDELRQHNREILRGFEELKERTEELAQIGSELESTNRGVVALHSELETTAQELRRVSEMKSRFLSNISHELRTPLNSILALARILLNRTDGPLSEEQEKQVRFIARAAGDLTELVNDLLDTAKVEAGKVEVRPSRFGLHELFGALRGVLRPLQTDAAVQLVFEDPSGVPVLNSDEGKIAQILRNFISNALKFTAHGEVRVAAQFEPPDRVLFSVRDTGIGIAPEFHERIFEEFEQIANPLQSRAKGTGLGLPLSRRLAKLLKGSVRVESEPGRGSTFWLDVPVHWSAAEAAPAGDRPRVLIADDEEAFRYVMRRMIDGDRFEVIEAADGEQALAAVREGRPAVVILDLNMPNVDGYQVLRRMQDDPASRDIPVIVSTSLILGEPDHARLAGAKAVISKSSLSHELVGSLLSEATELARA